MGFHKNPDYVNILIVCLKFWQSTGKYLGSSIVRHFFLGSVIVGATPLLSNMAIATSWFSSFNVNPVLSSGNFVCTKVDPKVKVSEACQEPKLILDAKGKIGIQPDMFNQMTNLLIPEWDLVDRKVGSMKSMANPQLFSFPSQQNGELLEVSFPSTTLLLESNDDQVPRPSNQRLLRSTKGLLTLKDIPSDNTFGYKTTEPSWESCLSGKVKGLTLEFSSRACKPLSRPHFQDALNIEHKLEPSEKVAAKNPNFPKFSRSSLLNSSLQQNNSSSTKLNFVHPAPDTKRVASPYGWRRRPYSGEYQFHHGIDYGAPLGSPVVAANDGIVTKVISGCRDFRSRWCGNQFGNWVEIDHGDGVTALYGHLLHQSITVKKGMKVWKNQEIAQVGSSGWSTGAHLDFRVKVNGQYRNPAHFVR